MKTALYDSLFEALGEEVSGKSKEWMEGFNQGLKFGGRTVREIAEDEMTKFK